MSVYEVLKLPYETSNQEFFFLHILRHTPRAVARSQFSCVFKRLLFLARMNVLWFKNEFIIADYKFRK